MSVVSRPWGRLSTAGKIILPLIAVFVALNLALVLLWVSGILPFLLQGALDRRKERRKKIQKSLAREQQYWRGGW